ncbi:E3 ubiquitin-protein ligase UPL6 isoform X2 [Hevea brasiliensis]|uniref:E3 ubiquitin-protein ligase UPL6 isoform X2 n=1 Tax=Hevea brasiliensis TaxID=3981 RepID=UPI0025FF3C13|nr:E3 ubiquitin-protein ligase UPL6 isoform X2 [Hevea brasiliensis]
MFFTGDPTTRKRVDLGGRSSKERDRQKLIEQTRLERNRRLWLRQQNSAAIKIQKCFRGRKAVEAEHDKWIFPLYIVYASRQSFGPDSEFLRNLFFFFNAQNNGDFTVLVETCRLLLQLVQDNGDIISLFGGVDYLTNHALVDYRVKQLAFCCIQAVYHNREQLKDQVLMTPWESSEPAVVLLEVVVLLIDQKLPWACKIVGYLLQRNVFTLFREIVLVGKENRRPNNCVGKAPSLERMLSMIISHVGQKPCICPHIDPLCSFSSQMLTIPFLWQLFPSLKEVFATRELSRHYTHQMALCVQGHANVLPNDVSAEYPGYACLLGNMLETAGVTLSQPDCSFEMAIDLAAVTTFLLETLPPIKSSSRETRENSTLAEDDAALPDEMEIVLNRDLEQQITNAINSRFLLQLTNVLFGEISLNGSHYGLDEKEVTAVGAACAFLNVIFNTLPLERIMTILAYRTDLVRVLWNFMKQCHEKQRWSSLPEQLLHLPADVPGWLLPLAVFCPVYKHMLMIVDNEEFYEQEKPLSLKDIRCLIIILRQALWQLLWVNPMAHNNAVKQMMNTSAYRRNPVESIKHRVSVVASELLSQLQDWNNRRQFTPPSDFHADGVDDFFISQAVLDGTKANDIMKRAPFLVPFTSRVKIFNSQLLAARQRNGAHGVFTRNRFRIRRDHILEDAYNQMSALSEEDLRGLIRVAFVNEFGVEEAGIDGGGIFKDFMENITRAAFDVQYGLFKETADHLLYPNPGSGMIHEQHLQFFHFLGTLLAKAMFEGILVDIPFATFFLSKLKQKFNYLNDLPSLDPELYRHLIFLKHYQGDISELELYFVIVNNEYGEQTEEELLPGGRNNRVTNENVITFIHLVSNHRLNFQIRQQSSHFLRGFQQLIQKDWIDMFNEHELQLLISGSLESLDVDDLRLHTNYAGGYHSEHYVIEMFWEVLKGFSLEKQKKFLKFVTGCSRGPLLGFKFLEPLFCIQRAAGSASEEALDRLPTSATCMNLLKLPPYRRYSCINLKQLLFHLLTLVIFLSNVYGNSKQQLETKLLYAINAEAGFDLS